MRQEQDARGLWVGRSERVAPGSATRGRGGELVQPPLHRWGRGDPSPAFHTHTAGARARGSGLPAPPCRFSVLLLPFPLSSLSVGRAALAERNAPRVTTHHHAPSCGSTGVWENKDLKDHPPSFTDEPIAAVERKVLEQCQLLLQSCLKTETFNLEVATLILGSPNKLRH